MDEVEGIEHTESDRWREERYMLDMRIRSATARDRTRSDPGLMGCVTSEAVTDKGMPRRTRLLLIELAFNEGRYILMERY